MASILPRQPTLDITDCDREPIHVPGAVQPHGLLLLANAAHEVVGGAGDIEGRLAADWLGRPLADLLGQPLAPLLDTLPAGPHALVAQPVEGRHERFTARLHRVGELCAVELEPAAADPMTAGATIAWLDAIATGFERSGDLQQLCERAAVAFRTLTGFDRVMIYRFLDDDAGRVIAEDRVAELPSFLHHHFPATDIPQQARALYVRNRTRSIPTIDYEPAPIRPAALAGIDLSDVAIRSVSPIHLRYLANMGVEASASISIVKDGLLWGLVACHHRTAHALPAETRAVAATLAGGLARQISAKEEAETYRERLRLRAGEDALLPRLERDEPLPTALAAAKADVRQLLDGDGFAVVRRGQVDAEGVCPDPALIAELARWARARGGEPFATHQLAQAFPGAAAATASASGLLALPLMDDEATLLWFRAERIEEIEWAGNPHKAVGARPGETLSPRASFASWTETVRGRSRRWTLEEIETAHRLRRRLHDLHQARRLRLLNDELGRTLADKDALLGQKDLLVKEMNHRVQNSLQLVAAFLRLQAKDADDTRVAELLGQAQARLAAVALVHRRLYRDDQVESIDLARYLDELAADMKASLGPDWAAQMRLDLAPVLVPTDRAVDLGLVLTELVINATKYAYGGAPGPIAVTLEQHRARLRLIVADHGRGKLPGDQDASGGGFGSRMMAAMVQRLGGTLDYDDNAPGLRAMLTAPIEALR